MINAIKNVIQNKDYKLEELLYKINKMYIESRITEQEKEELDSLARTNAKAESNYDIQKQIDELRARVEVLEGNTQEETTEEYQEFKQPTGAHNTYNIGDKIIFNDKKYICKLDNCVWSPDTYPQAWEEIVEIGG